MINELLAVTIFKLSFVLTIRLEIKALKLNLVVQMQFLFVFPKLSFKWKI